jgi:glutamyl-tRNA reductase
MNHRSAPVELREQMAFSAEGTATALMLLHDRWPNSEAVLLSTCNRLELLVVTEDDKPDVDDLVTFLAQARDLPANTFRPHLYAYRDEQAIRHLFRVASGLDSLVVGEYQIVNQLKQAYTTASEQGTTGKTTNRLMHQAFRASAKVRTNTEIGQRKVSVPSVAVDLARSIFSDFSDKQTLIVGAGEMAQLVCKHLQELDVHRFTVVSRTLNNARALADACHGCAVPYDQLEQELASADIVITATRCPRPIITAEKWQRVRRQRGGRPVYMIDLAVPRNIDPSLGRMEQVYLQNIDSLGAVVAENEQARIEQIDQCEKLLDHEIAELRRWLAEAESGPLIAQMYQDARTLRDMELEKLQRSCPDLTPQQRAAVSQLADRLINKFMHPCVQTVKKQSDSPPSKVLARTLHELTDAQSRHANRRTPDHCDEVKDVAQTVRA